MSDIDWSKAPVIIHSEAVERFYYSPESGKIYHVQAFHKNKIGKEALSTKNQAGYLYGTINGKSVRAHRLAFFLMTGRWPLEIDHVDGNKCNNKWDNLREVSSRDNQRNRPIPASSKTGVMGVWYREKRKSPFVASWIDFEGKKITRQFSTMLDAVAARKSAETKFGYHQNHGRPLQT